MRITVGRNAKTANVLLWVVQGLLAATFLFAGGMKLVMPIAELTRQTPLPGTFIRFVGVLEVAGALGLIVPGILRLRTILTPAAAVGLIIIMSGALGATLATGDSGAALAPVIVGFLLAFVAFGRWRLASRAEARGSAPDAWSRAATLQSAA